MESGITIFREGLFDEGRSKSFRIFNIDTELGNGSEDTVNPPIHEWVGRVMNQRTFRSETFTERPRQHS